MSNTLTSIEFQEGINVFRVCGVLQRGHSGDGCDLASTVCRCDLRMGVFYCF